MILNDLEIAQRCLADRPMIAPFESEQIRTVNNKKIVSYGLSSFGYDIRLGTTFKLFTNTGSIVVDPKEQNDKGFVDFETDEYCVIPPNSFALAHTLERFVIPRDIITLCVGKSTYARCGLVVNVTPFEPEWEGVATLELSNTTPCPMKVYALEGIAQLMFLKGNACYRSYADKKGKYQNTSKLEMARI